jgi:hypothetical protein
MPESWRAGRWVARQAHRLESALLKCRCHQEEALLFLPKGIRSRKLGVTGFEPAASTENSLRNEPVQAEEAQLPAQLMNDPQFGNVMQAWQDLPQAIRAGILAMIAATQLPGTQPPR